MRELNVNEFEQVNGGNRLKVLYEAAAAVLVATGAVDAYNDFMEGFEEGYEEKDKKES